MCCNNLQCRSDIAQDMPSTFPPVPADEYLTRRDQIGVKKRKKEDKKKGNEEGGEEDEKQEPDQAPPPKRGRGGRGGRGRGRGAMKRPAAKPAVEETEQEAEDQEETDEENPGDDDDDDDEVVEGANGSASSSAPAGLDTSAGLRRAAPLKDGDEEAPAHTADATPKAKAKGKGKGRGKAKTKAPTNDEPTNPDWPWHKDVRQRILDCLHECKEAKELGMQGKHTHRAVEAHDENQQYSIYWTRSAVGVKVRSGLADKWNQVAYFAKPSPCIFTNVVIAEEWADS